MLVKSEDAAGLFTKTRYDGAGRLVSTKTSYDTVESAYADALNCVYDSVLEKTKYFYDGDGNIVAEASFRRYAGGTTTIGCISGDNSYATSVVYWYDPAGRQTHSANIGHESGAGTRYVFGTGGLVIDTDADGHP